VRLTRIHGSEVDMRVAWVGPVAAFGMVVVQLLAARPAPGGRLWSSCPMRHDAIKSWRATMSGTNETCWGLKAISYRSGKGVRLLDSHLGLFGAYPIPLYPAGLEGCFPN
jgi:hypothetical protein